MKKAKQNKSGLSIADHTVAEMEVELLLVSDKNNAKEYDPQYELDMVKSRESKGGSKVLQLSSNEYPKAFKPLYLTKIGHGLYYKDTMSMDKFCDCKTDLLVEKTKDALLQYPTIKRINLYACKSGLTPIALKNDSLETRMKSKMVMPLSFCEEFALKLMKSFEAKEGKLPKTLTIVGALGDTKPGSNGKITVSGEKRNIFQDPYVQIDRKSCLIELDVNQFATCYKTAEKNLPVNAGLIKFSFLGGSSILDSQPSNSLVQADDSEDENESQYQL